MHLLHYNYNYFPYNCARVFIRLYLQVTRCSVPEVQCLLITLITKNITLFDTHFLLETFRNLLVIPCPTVRQQTVSLFHCLTRLDPTQFQQLADVFLENIALEAPYHSLALSLSFVLEFAHTTAVSGRSASLQVQLLELEAHTDNEILVQVNSVLEAINRTVYVPKNEPAPRIEDSVDRVADFMATAQNVSTLLELSTSNLSAKIYSIKRELPFLVRLGRVDLLQLADISVALVVRLLDMITQDSSQDESFTAPSFEETFVIIEATVSGDDEFCKRVGKLVWEVISGLLELLCSIGKLMACLVMTQFVLQQECGDITRALSNIGDTSLKCIFR